MGKLFERLDGKEGRFTVTPCNRMICNGLAKANAGGHQAIEGVEAKRRCEFANLWDSSTNGAGRLRAINRLLGDSFLVRELAAGIAINPEDAAVEAALSETGT
jgi:hypothetical protein